jgi:hypothetical protein
VDREAAVIVELPPGTVYSMRHAALIRWPWPYTPVRVLATRAFRRAMRKWRRKRHKFKRCWL